jgi:hypothetical protein
MTSEFSGRVGILSVAMVTKVAFEYTTQLFQRAERCACVCVCVCVYSCEVLVIVVRF